MCCVAAAASQSGGGGTAKMGHRTSPTPGPQPATRVCGSSEKVVLAANPSFVASEKTVDLDQVVPLNSFFRVPNRQFCAQLTVFLSQTELYMEPILYIDPTLSQW